MDLPARSVRLASWPSQFEGLFIGNSNFSILDLAPNNGSLAHYNDCSAIDLGTDCPYLELARVSQRCELA